MQCYCGALIFVIGVSSFVIGHSRVSFMTFILNRHGQHSLLVPPSVPRHRIRCLDFETNDKMVWSSAFPIGRRIHGTRCRYWNCGWVMMLIALYCWLCIWTSRFALCRRTYSVQGHFVGPQESSHGSRLWCGLCRQSSECYPECWSRSSRVGRRHECLWCTTR